MTKKESRALVIAAAVVIVIPIVMVVMFYPYGQGGLAYHPSMRSLIFDTLLLAVYFLPALNAYKKRDYKAILVRNILLGWTIIGWIVAMIWAMKTDPPVYAVKN
jgi:hypothetical protein